MTVRDVFIAAVSMAVVATIACVLIIIYLPSDTSIPIVAMIGSVITTMIAPIITNIVVSRIVTPVQASQKDIHERLRLIEHDVNSTATEMAARLEALRARNLILELAAAHHAIPPPPPEPDLETEIRAKTLPVAQPFTKDPYNDAS